MITEYIPNYLYSEDLTIDQVNHQKLSGECLFLEELLNIRFKDAEKYVYGGDFKSVSFKNYNLFTFPSHNLMALYREIQRVIHPYLPHPNYMCQAWLNVYREGQSIGWHHHWEADFESYHGFYCVDVETTSSETAYRLRDDPDKIYKVPSRNGRLVFGKSSNDQHTSSIWRCTTPRITIAFDIVPVQGVQLSAGIDDKEVFINGYKVNHYIPFK